MEFKTGINDLPLEVIVLIFKELPHKDVFENYSNSERSESSVREVERIGQRYVR